MDVTGWTGAQRMRLPDWCFGSRQVISARVSIGVANTFAWAMSDIALPDPCCLWRVGIFIRTSDDASNYMRMGMSEDVPVNEDQMNDAVEILPDYGDSGFSPEKIYLFNGGPFYMEIKVRKHLVTGGRQLVVEGKTSAGATVLAGMIHVVVSGLPTDMAGWLEHSRV